LESLGRFFDYLKDEEENNVIHERTGSKENLNYSGFKIVRGEYNEHGLKAELLLRNAKAKHADGVCGSLK
jgi:hypothetical protein